MQIPGESIEYRAARDALTVAEAELRAAAEKVAAERRRLPQGAAVGDYRFVTPRGETVALNELAGPGQQSLFIYNFMYAPAIGQGACPMCCGFLDGLNGAAPALTQQAGLAVVARATPEELAEIGAQRNWRNLRLYSSGGDFARNFGGESADGGQLPMMHVFERDTSDQGGFRHFWSSEMFFHQSNWPAHPRHMDMIWSYWNLLDLTRNGRG